MKKLLLLISTYILIICLTGCKDGILPQRIELDELMIIRAVGLDKGCKNPDNICVTIISKEIEGNESGRKSGESKSEQAIIMSNEAATIFQAEREFQTYSDKRMFWEHVDFFLISEEAAREGIPKYIDFLVRDHEMRLNSKIYIIKDTTAKEFIEKSSKGEFFMPDRLKAIGKNSKLFTGTQELEIVEFMQWLNNEYSCAVAPVLYLKKVEGEILDGQKQCMDIELGGYAVFKKLKLVTILNRKQARGENFILNRVITGVIETSDLNGEMVGLDIISNKTEITPAFNGGVLSGILVKVKMTSNVDEVHSTSDIFNKESLNHLSYEQSEIVKAEIEEVYRIAQKNNYDFVDIANVISTRYPAKWEKYKDKWEEIFPELPVKVEVETKVVRTYDIREPSGVYEKEHK